HAARRRHSLLPLPIEAGGGHRGEPRERRQRLQLHLRPLPLLWGVDRKAGVGQNREVSFDGGVDVCHDSVAVSALETYDWVDTTNHARLVADFARAHMLVALFDGDPKKWIEFLDQNGTPEERQRELPVARDFQRRLASDPKYIDRLRTLVRDVSTLLPS